MNLSYSAPMDTNKGAAMNASYYVTETVRNTFAVMERVKSGSRRSEYIIGEYRSEKDADEHATQATERLWAKRLRA